MYIVIVGGGKLGAYLAGTLLREDNQVALIEKCDAQARRLAEAIDGSCLVISGDGCSASVQEDAAMQSADVFVAATGQTKTTWLRAKLPRACSMYRAASPA